MAETGIRVTSKVSQSLNGNPFMSEFNEKLKELQEIAKKISPEGSLYIRMFDRNEIYSPEAKAIRGSMSVESLYTLRALQSNPKLASEFSELGVLMNSIDKIVYKRKKEIQEKRKGK